MRMDGQMDGWMDFVVWMRLKADSQYDARPLITLHRQCVNACLSYSATERWSRTDSNIILVFPWIPFVCQVAKCQMWMQYFHESQTRRGATGWAHTHTHIKLHDYCTELVMLDLLYTVLRFAGGRLRDCYGVVTSLMHTELTTTLYSSAD